MSRRAQLDPASVGLPASPVARRRRGLRREEVAALAGVSVDYYARLEQGRIGNVSDQVLTAIEDALRLGPLEREHLRSLVSTPPPGKARRPAVKPAKARSGIRALITAMEPIPAILQNSRMDILAWNRSAKVLPADFDAMSTKDRNVARRLFLDPTTRIRYPDWEAVAAPTVAALRAAYNPNSADEGLEQLVGEMTLNYETLSLPDSGGQFISTYTADAGSPSDERLRILLSWHETPAETERTG